MVCYGMVWYDGIVWYVMVWYAGYVCYSTNLAESAIT